MLRVPRLDRAIVQVTLVVSQEFHAAQKGPVRSAGGRPRPRFTFLIAPGLAFVDLPV